MCMTVFTRNEFVFDIERRKRYDLVYEYMCAEMTVDVEEIMQKCLDSVEIRR